MENPASGNLVDIALTDVLQVLSINRKTCTLYLKKGNERGEISLLEGQIADSRSGDRRGEDAFFHLLGWEKADFFISSTPNPALEQTISRDLHVLILEWLDKQEEGGKTVAPPPAAPTPETVQVPPSREAVPAPSRAAEKPVAKTADQELLSFLKHLETSGLIRPLS